MALLDKISADTKVGDILEQYPETLDIFLEYGFTPLNNPTVRKKVASKVSLSKACLIKSVKVDDLVNELQSMIDKIGKNEF